MLGPCLSLLLGAPVVSALQGPSLLLSPEDSGTENASWGSQEAQDNESSVHTVFFSLDYQHVQVPFEITLWIMLASLAKIGKEPGFFWATAGGRGEGQSSNRGGIL